MTVRALAPVGATRRRARVGPAVARPAGSFLISTHAPGHTQVALARLVTGVLAALFLAALAYQHVRLARLDSFIPVANTVVGLNDFLTALLLYAQFSVTRARALLVLASGFLFKTLILIPHAATFPGVFGPFGLLGDRLQSTTWMFPIQQVAFMVCAIAYTVLSDREVQAPPDDEPVAPRIAATIAGTVAAAVLITWFLIAEDSHLPRLIAADAVHASEAFRRIIAPLELSMCLGSIVVLRRRAKSMIDLWLQVAIWSWVFEAILMTLVTGRFTFIFYANRAMGMVSSAFMLLALLSESLMLHRRLVLATAARDQEREGHRTTMDVVVGALAHELRQPLTAIMINGQAGDVVLSTAPEDVGEARAAFHDITRSVVRANEVIDSVRALFTHSPSDRVTVDVNDLVREALGIMRIDLEAYRIVLDLDLFSGLPSIRGHRGQLLQVLINGIRNAVESLATVAERDRQLRVRTRSLEPNRVEIRVEDSGRGVEPTEREHLFDPFHSTKPHGMGLGLSICKSIMETHEGFLTLLPRSPCGAVFQVVLPTIRVHDESSRSRRHPGPLDSKAPAMAARPIRLPARVSV